MTWPEHPYHSRGAQQDRAKTWGLLERVAEALERIATVLEEVTVEGRYLRTDIQQRESGR